MLLQDKIGLVTGVANQRSAAWSIARACDAAGAKIVLSYRGEREKEGIDGLVDQLARPPRVLPCDVTDDEQLGALAESIRAEHGRVDFLVHSLAFAKREDLSGRFIDTSRDGFLLAHEVSAYSLAALARALEPLMSGGGSIVALSYIGAVRAVPNYNVMGVAKASLEATIRYLAADLGPGGVRVNGISAGPMRTLAAAAVAGFKDMYSHQAEIAPLRRNTTQEEVGDTAVFLVSDMSRGITGDIIYVDGGYHITHV